jgi:phospholipase/carboxylesterase
MAVTCNGGYVMRAWYDVISLDSTSRRIDEAGIITSRDAVRLLIEREKSRGIPVDRIFIAGFSQGGAVAYTTALTHPEKLAGIIALSTYIPSPALLTEDSADANRAIPIFAAHGTADDVVSPTLGLAARNLLIERGYDIDWHEYPMPHSVCLEEVWAIGQWLAAQIRRQAESA